jgi:iron complex transport system ATP-binding protein
MELVRSLRQSLGLTVVMVLHDLNHAFRYSDRIVALKDGQVFADGPAREVLNEENFAALYNVRAARIDMCKDGEEYCVFLPYSVSKENGGIPAV